MEYLKAVLEKWIEENDTPEKADAAIKEFEQKATRNRKATGETNEPPAVSGDFTEVTHGHDLSTGATVLQPGAEQSILGCIINRADTYKHLCDGAERRRFLRPGAQSNPSRTTQSQGGTARDLVTVGDILEQLFPNAVAKVTSTVIDCAQQVQYTNVDSYLRTVKELSVERKAITLIAEIQKSYKTHPDHQRNNGQAAHRAGDMLVSKHSWMTMTDVLLKTFSYIEQRVKEVRA